MPSTEIVEGAAMRRSRRSFLRLAASAAALPALPRLSRAQAYPARPVKVLVGQAAGSSSDITARLVGQFVSQRLGQQFVIEVRPGAAGNIATEAAVNAPPDGYTILLINAQNTINHALYDKLNFNFLRDIAPIAGIDRVPLVMEVHPSFPANSVAEFIAYAKANPGKVNMASAGIGGPQHVAGELFKFMAGVNLQHVPYRGSTPALTDLIGGQVQVMFDVTPSSVPHIKSGKLRALGVTTATRLDVLPDVPPIADVVPGYEASAWIGFGAPKNTPADIIDTLNKAFNAAIADAAIKARLAELGAVAMPANTPAEFAQHIAADADKWAKVIKASGIKPE
jgi:tripartite-type tricarboxylate transporter receptor subunit TctC